MAFDIYDIIPSRNVYLDDESAMKHIEINFIIVEVVMKHEMIIIFIKKYHQCVQFVRNFSLGEQTFVAWIESDI